MFSIVIAPLSIPTIRVPFTLYSLADIPMENLGVLAACFTFWYKGQGPSCIPSIMTSSGIYCLLILVLLRNFAQRSCTRGVGYTFNSDKERVNGEVILCMFHWTFVIFYYRYYTCYTYGLSVTEFLQYS